MSWIEDIETLLEITTGDSKTYQPLWKPANLITSYHVTEFDFPDVPGTKVDRKAPKGNKYGIELYFNGQDHLQIAEAFRISSNDPRPWTITHPYYGELLVHPSELEFDNTKYNSSKITGTVLETISDTYPDSTAVPEDQIIQDKDSTDETTANSFANNNPNPNTQDIAQMNTTIDNINATTGTIITDNERYSNFQNAVNQAKNDITGATTGPLAAMRSIQTVINFPFEVQQSIQIRMHLLSNQFTALLNQFINAPDAVPRSQKIYFESAAITMLGAMAVNSITQNSDEDYDNTSKVTSVIELILSSYDAFLDAIDTLQSDDTDNDDAYLPDFQSLFELETLINYTLSNLFTIAQLSRQQRTVILEDDSDIINVTHRFYGLDSEDENIDNLVANNDIGYNELLTLKKGRKIVYFV